MNNELILFYDQKISILALQIFPFLIIISGWILYLSTFWNAILESIVLLRIFQIFLMLIVLLFFIGFIYIFKIIKDRKPVAILSSQGIWINRYGFISWDKVQQFGTYTIYTTPIQNIAIRLKDNNDIYKQSTFEGKMTFINARIFGYPPIILANVDHSNEEIIAFAKNYISITDKMNRAREYIMHYNKIFNIFCYFLGRQTIICIALIGSYLFGCAIRYYFTETLEVIYNREQFVYFFITFILSSTLLNFIKYLYKKDNIDNIEQFLSK